MEHLFFPDRRSYHPSRRTYYPSTASEPSSPSPSPAQKPKIISIPVHGPDTNISPSPSDPKTKNVSIPVQAPDTNNRDSVNIATAASRIQKVVRGFLVRKNMKIVRKIAIEAEEIGSQMSPERIRGNDKERLRINEMLMKLLLRLDAVRGVREYRKKVIRRVIQLQEAVDSIAQDVMDSCQNTEENKMDDTVTAAEAAEEGHVMIEAADTQAMEDTEDHTDEIESIGMKDVKEPREETSTTEEAALMKEMMERSAAESEALTRMVMELCERSAQQCELMRGMVQRVEQLEKRVQGMERRKKKKGNSHSKKH